MIRDLTTGDDRCLTEGMEGRVGGRGGLISPDNRWVVYRWRAPMLVGPTPMRIVGIDASGDRLLHANDEQQNYELQQWSPDSRCLLAVFYDSDGERLTNGTAHIALFSIEGQSFRTLKTLTPEENGNPSPRFSPDGRYIVYDRRLDKTSGRKDIYLLPLDGGPEIPVVESPARDDVPRWLPGGETLLFRSNRRGEGYDAWMIRVVDGKPVGVPRLVQKDAPYLRGPVRAPDGGWAFYYSKRVATKYVDIVYVATLDAETGKLSIAPERITQPAAGRERALRPDFSRDGKYLAYFVAPACGSTSAGSWRCPPGNIVVIRSLETGHESDITLSRKLSLWSRLLWAPDGRSIFTHGKLETGVHGIFRLDTETGRLDPVVLSEMSATVKSDVVRFAELSPNGQTLFFHRYDEPPNAWKTLRSGPPLARTWTQSRIVARDLETDEEKEIYRIPEGVFVSSLLVSPDGQRVAIGDQESVKILPTTGGETRELVRFERKTKNWIAAWMPDSRHLLFLKSEPDRAELWRISADGGQPERLGNLFGGRPPIVRQVRMHPDGRQIAFATTQSWSQHRIRMMQIIVSDEMAKEMCTENLRTIARAIQQYKNDHDDVPNWLSDLYPGYLQDTSLLLCPAERTGRRVLRGPEDPKMPCSYSYTFHSGTKGVSGLDVALPVDFPAREGMTCKEARKLQLEYYGPVLPVAMCHHRYRVLLFLGYDGEVYETDAYYWEGSSQAKAGLLSQLRSAMESQPATWGQRYDMQRFASVLDNDAALTKLLKTCLKEHPEDEAAREFLAEVPRLRFPCRSSDDAEEDGKGQMYLYGSNLKLIHDNKRGDQVVGIRFPDIPVPQAARIKRAYLQLTGYPEDPGSEKTDLVAHAELAANAKPFAEPKHNITSRRKTAASVKWSPEPWSVGGERSEKQRTPDLSSVIQEVVNQPDWQEGNAVVLIISGSGRRNAESWDGGWSGEPMLYVEH